MAAMDELLQRIQRVETLLFLCDDETMQRLDTFIKEKVPVDANHYHINRSKQLPTQYEDQASDLYSEGASVPAQDDLSRQSRNLQSEMATLKKLLQDTQRQVTSMELCIQRQEVAKLISDEALVSKQYVDKGMEQVQEDIKTMKLKLMQDELTTIANIHKAISVLQEDVKTMDTRLHIQRDELTHIKEAIDELKETAAKNNTTLLQLMTMCQNDLNKLKQEIKQVRAIGK